MNSKIVGTGIVFLLFVLFAYFFIRPMMMKKSGTAQVISGANVPRSAARGAQDVYSTVNASEDNFKPADNMGMGMGVSTSMLPREIPSQEDFGSFSPADILSGQNYLDPRAQIGYPETFGGVLRNANLDVRSEPPNPRTPVSIFNNSTIVPDMMRPPFEIGRN